MNDRMAITAFDTRPVQQALHAIAGCPRTVEGEALFGDLKTLARTLGKLGAAGDTASGGDVSARRSESIRHGSASEVLKRAAKHVAEKGYKDLGNTLDRQADALGGFEDAG
jgi:hypothetical protein